MFSYFYILQWKKIQKDLADFWHRQMTLKTRIVLYLTFRSKSIQIPRMFLWLLPQTFDLTYLPLNPPRLNCSSEVPLKDKHTYLKLVSVPSFIHHMAWIWIWMVKRPVVASDGNFSSCLIRRSGYSWLFPT